MGILLDIVYLILGLGLLYFGAEWLVGGAAKIAVKYGISPLVVGLTIVAFGTSAPELFVSIGFNFDGFPDMSVGNVVGSNICNIGLVLGVSAFICALYVKSELLIRDLPLLILASLIFVWMIMNGSISRLEGTFLFLAVIGYTVFQLYLSRRVADPAVVKEFEEEFGNPEEFSSDPLWKLALLVVGGLVLLYFGSDRMQVGGVGLAQRFGVPEAVISLTLIAFATSVPELATSAVAALKKEGDIIVGNVIGSCIFNILCVIGVTAVLKPIEVTQIENVDLILMISLAIILVPVMLSRRRVSRLEGAFLLLVYAGYCAYLWVERIQPAMNA